MRPVLLRIPLDGSLNLGPLGSVPVFGFGLIFGIWFAIGLFLCIRRRRDHQDFVLVDWLQFGILGAAIVLTPRIAARFSDHPSIPVNGYGLMMCLGFVFGTLTAARRAAQAGISAESIWDLTFWFLLCGVGGGRLFYLIQHGDRVFAHSETVGDYLIAAINLPEGGLVLYGGLFLCAAFFWWFCRSRNLSAWKLGDVLVPSVFLGIAFGRVGCFFYGCCFGDRCDLPWAVTFPPDGMPFQVQLEQGFIAPDATASLPIHPTQIYSVIDALLLSFLTSAYYRVKSSDGSVVALMLLTYPITRFLIERLRGDEMGQFGTSLTIAQWISLVMFVAGIAIAIARPPLPRRPAG